MSFDTLLVANRGEIARRVIRTARSMGLRCVAVYVDADRHAPFVSDADAAVRLDTGHLDGGAVIDAARRTGAGAVHPGYGFLSEHAGFARSVEAAGLVWVGPSADAIDAMGDKIEAKRHAEAAGVPTLPSSGDPADADTIGYPILVKAAAGGGGKGMRIVTGPDDLDEAVASARREALSGFGDERVFIERYVAASRHVEIQILGDTHGTLIHLGERECSIQRRHQKLIEESPSPVVDAELRGAMTQAALRLGRAMDYYSTGTVEFLVDDDTRQFYFLEVNTRLQVEHPVTEEVTGIDLVRQQLLVSQGLPIELDQDDVVPTGHAIEARLCAEDPERGFLPATGTLVAFDPGEESGVRWESGVVQGSDVTVDFDPLLAKVIAHAPTRDEAASTLALALERLHLGGVTTNRDFLAATLRTAPFRRGDTTTDFIDRVHPALVLRLDEEEFLAAAITAAMARQSANRHLAPVLAPLPSGWRNARLPDQHVEFESGDRSIEIDYRARRDGTFLVNGEHVVRVVDARADGIDLEIGDRRVRSRVTVDGGRYHVQVARGTIELVLVPPFAVPGTELPAGGLVAPMPGVVIDIRVAVDDHVSAGTTLVVMEAMKMEQHVRAPIDGVVTDVHVRAGQQVENGAVLLSLAPIDPDGATS